MLGGTNIVGKWEPLFTCLKVEKIMSRLRDIYTVAAHLRAAALMVWKLSTFSPKVTVHKLIFLCTKEDSKWQVRLLTQSGS